MYVCEALQLVGFRLSSHCLEIEKGLHCSPEDPWKERICIRCASQKVDALRLWQESSHFDYEIHAFCHDDNLYSHYHEK